jgi:hypothetical protein
MSAAPMIAGLPPDCVLSAGYVVRLTALDPSTGATVAGVQLSEVSFFVTDLAPTGADTIGDAPLPLLVPSDQIA